MDFNVIVFWIFLIQSITRFVIKLNEFKISTCLRKIVWIIKNSFKYKTFDVTV